MVKTVSIFFFFTLLETMIFMHIQATSVGLARCISESQHVDYQLACSTGLSICTTCLTWMITTKNVVNIYFKIGKASTEPTCAKNLPNYQRGKAFNEKAQKYLRHVWLVVYAAISIIFLVFLIWGAVKLWMNSISCLCGWNYKGFPL